MQNSEKFNTGTVMDMNKFNSDNTIGTDNLNIDTKYLRKTRTKVREYNKIGRNDLCPCGSGKKYKNCCLNTGKYENLHELTALEMANLKNSKLNISNMSK